MSAVALPADITCANAALHAQSLVSRLQADAAGGGWQVDASALDNFDSSALSVLLQLKRQAQLAGVSVTLLHAPSKLMDLARLYGVDNMLWPQATPAQELQ